MDILTIIQLVEGDRSQKMFFTLTFSFSGQEEYPFWYSDITWRDIFFDKDLKRYRACLVLARIRRAKAGLAKILATDSLALVLPTRGRGISTGSQNFGVAVKRWF
jgi:hypothetical protein